MKKILCMMLMLISLSMSGFAQSLADYILTTGTDATKWQTLTTTTSLITSTGDGVASGLTDIGFTFNFGGTDYTQFSVNSDGNLRFGSTVTGTANYSTPFSVSNASVNAPKINMLGCDGFLTDSGHVYCEVIGTAPDRVCVIEFATSTYNTTSRPSLLRWQVQLFETSNNIQIVYAPTTPPILPNVARQPGMSVDGNSIVLLDNNHNATFYTAGQSTNTCPTGTWPDVNRYYLFELTNCLTPSNLTCDTISIADMMVSWHNANSGNSFVLQYKAASESWDNDAVTVYPYDTFYFIGGLTENTVYNVRVQADCGTEQSNWTYLTVKTPCTDLSSLPFFENFDGVEGTTSTSAATNNLPDCWSYLNAGTSTTYSGYPIVYNSSTYASSGSNAMRFYIYSTSGTYDDQMAILPAIDASLFPVNTLQLEFDARQLSSSYSFTLVVGVLTMPTDKNTFVPVDTISVTSTTYQHFEIPLNNYTGTGNYIAIMAPKPSSSYNEGYVDNVLVSVIPACEEPTNVTASNATTTSFDLTWTENGSATSWEVEYGPAGFILGQGTTETATGLPFTLSNLEPSTAYDVYVRSDCGTGTDYSGYSNRITAYTLCEMISTLPFEENFDSHPGYSTTTAATTNLPYCWSKLNTGTSTSYSGYPIIYTSATYAQSGTNSLRFYTTSTSGTYDDQMAILPQFDVSANPMSTMQISFDARNYSSYTFTVIVGILTNPADKTTFEPIDTIVTTSNNYNNYIVRFSDYMGEGTYIGLMAKKPTTSYCSGFIDNIVVDLIPPCAAPYNVVATSTPNDTVFVTWDDALGSQWDVIYGPTGFDPDSSTEAITEYGFTSTNAAITGLPAGMLYDFYVRTNCGSEVSEWNASPATGAPYLYIMGVTGSDTISTCGTTITDDGGPNGDYSNNCHFTLVIYPSEADSVVSVSGSFSGETTVDYLSIYDGTAVDPENLFEKVVSGTSGTVVNFGPFTSETGPITLLFHTDGSVVKPGFVLQTSCEAAPSCAKPFDLHTTIVTNTEATITWDAIGASSFNVAYSTSATFDPATCPDVATSSTNDVTLNNLTPNTPYYVAVQSNCGSDLSEWSNVLSFTTACDPITILPFSENFDSVTGSTTTSVAVSNLPYCWSNINEGTSTSYSGYPIVYASATYAQSGTNSLRFYTYSTVGTYDDQMAVLPMIDPTLYPINTLQMSFDARLISASYPFMLVAGVLTSPTDKSTFVPVDTINVSSTTYQHYELTFSSYDGNGAYIALMAPRPATSYNEGYLDNILVEEIPSCPKPMDLTVTTVAATSVGLSWTEIGSASSWEIEYGAPGFTPGGTAGTVVQVTDNPYVLDNLTPATTYDIYVRSDCSTEYSQYSTKVTVTTTCMPIDSMPYAESFDTYGTGSSTYPTCWNRINTYTTSSTNYPYITTTHYDGVGALYLYAGTSGTYNFAISPMIDETFPVNTLKTSFMYRTGNATSFLVVGVMTNPTDASTFVPIDTVMPTASSVWEPFEVSFSQYTGEGQYIAFKNAYTSTTGYGYLDSVVIDLIPSCPRPLNVTASNATTTSVDLSWIQDGSPASWVIEYGPSGFTPGTGNEVTANTNPFTVTGLDHSTMYDFYVTADCGGGDVSPTSFVYSASTACAAIDQLPFTENFDAYGTGTTAYPICWSKYNTYTSSPNMPYINSTNYAGSGSLYFYCTSGYYNVAITPEFDASIPINTLQATFMYRASNATNDRLIVGVMTNPADFSTFVAVDTIHPASTASTWIEKEVVFSGYTGSGHYIAFHNGNPTASCYTYIDNLQIDLIPTCPKPQDLHVVSTTTNSIELGWTEVATATSWEIAYGATGFDPDGTAATIVTATTNPFTVQNLNSATGYQFYVRALCSATDQSPWSQPTSGATQCAGTVSLPYAEDFEGYTGTTYQDANGIAPACWTTYSTNTTYGAPHITSSGSYHYVHSGTNCMVFTCGSAGSDAYAALPTFNQPLNTLTVNFWRAMESATNGSTLTVGYVTDLDSLQSSFVTVATIPSVTSSNGDTISVDFTDAAIPANGNICFHWYYGTSFYSCCIDDIAVTSNGSGPVVTDPTVATNAATLIAQTSATLNATITNPDNVTISAKGFEWKATTGGTYTQVTGTGTGNTFTAGLTNLTPNTNYTYKAFITFNGTTVYGSEMTFTTLEQGQVTEPSATTLPASAIAQTTATLNGTIANPDNVTITAQGFEWKQASAATYTVVNASGATMSSPITGLTANTDYTYRAFVTTASGTYYGANVSFTTLEEPVVPCDVPTGLTASEITGESIVITWNDNPDVSSWNIQYRPQGGQLSTASSNTNTYTITGLTNNTTYQIQVQANCGDGNLSDWSPAITVTTTGIENRLENSVALYPNPAKEYVDIRVDGDLNITMMEVYDVYGKLLNTVNVVENPTRINVSNLSNGMYFVRVTTEAGLVTKTFVKK